MSSLFISFTHRFLHCRHQNQLPWLLLSQLRRILIESDFESFQLALKIRFNFNFLQSDLRVSLVRELHHRFLVFTWRESWNFWSSFLLNQKAWSPFGLGFTQDNSDPKEQDLFQKLRRICKLNSLSHLPLKVKAGASFGTPSACYCRTQPGFQQHRTSIERLSQLLANFGCRFSKLQDSAVNAKRAYTSQIIINTLSSEDW